MSLIRFDGSDDLGASGALWGNLFDWVNGTLSIPGAAFEMDDFCTYNAGGITLLCDTGSAATVQTESYGVVKFAASKAFHAVSGWQRNEYVDPDATTFKEFCMEARLKAVDDDGTDEKLTFDLTEEALDGYFGTDAASDGSSLGLVWNDDETVNLVSVASDDTLTALIDEIAAAVRTDGFHSFGLSVKQETTSTLYTVRASVNGVVKKVTTSTIPRATNAADCYDIVADWSPAEIGYTPDGRLLMASYDADWWRAELCGSSAD